MERTRVLIAKIGLDGHDVGAKVIAATLRDAGMEVIYTGLRQTPENIVQTAIQEDVDAIGISILSGAHQQLISELLRVLEKEDASDIRIVAGGVIPEDDAEELKSIGVYEVFQAESEMEAIINCFESLKQEKSDIT